MIKSLIAVMVLVAGIACADTNTVPTTVHNQLEQELKAVKAELVLAKKEIARVSKLAKKYLTDRDIMVARASHAIRALQDASDLLTGNVK